jgi:hypothetical protein
MGGLKGTGPMKALTAFASAAALALTVAATAAPAHAAVFAQFTPDNRAMDFRWIKSTTGANAGTGGHLFTITPTTQNATTAQGVATHFSFLDPSLAALAFLKATFTLDATISNSPSHAATQNGSQWTETNLDGHFSFIYAGPTTTIGGVHLVNGMTNLLSGVFTDAFIQGAGGSGSINETSITGGTLTFTSGVEHFSNLIPGSEAYAFNLLAVSPVFGASLHKALNSFRANGGGNFSMLQAAPEPGTWGLMIVGFGGMGMVFRARRRAAIASA